VVAAAPDPAHHMRVTEPTQCANLDTVGASHVRKSHVRKSHVRKSHVRNRCCKPHSGPTVPTAPYRRAVSVGYCPECHVSRPVPGASRSTVRCEVLTTVAIIDLLVVEFTAVSASLVRVPTSGRRDGCMVASSAPQRRRQQLIPQGSIGGLRSPAGRCPGCLTHAGEHSVDESYHKRGESGITRNKGVVKVRLGSDSLEGI
jgi:hypothetical protein